MIGIYKITNKTNGHSYIGQSIQIETRWNNHKIAAFNPNDKGYEYPLYRAFRKYGLENFKFEVIEECSQSQLNEKENYWIKYYNPEYNQTLGGDAHIVPQKLTFEQVKEIKQILKSDINGLVSHKALAETYGVHKDTIRDINVGRTWYDENESYPLHISQFDQRHEKKIYYCQYCGKIVSKGQNRCVECYRKQNENPFLPTREELKQLIRTTPFTTIGTKYHLSDNAIRKWCDKFNLPRTKKEINSYSDEEWKLI